MTIAELRALLNGADDEQQVLALIKGHTGYREVHVAYLDSDGDLIVEPDMDVTE